jgi:hypothetical protein
MHPNRSSVDQTKDHSSEEPLMEVDDPIPDPSIPVGSTSLPERPKFDLPDQALREACNILERKIDPDDEDDLILDSLWFFVHRALSQYPELSGALANKEEFGANVKRQGQKEFIELVKDLARRKCWRDLLDNGISPSLTTSPSIMPSVQTCF